MRAVPFLLVYITPVAWLAGWHFGGLSTLATPILIFILIPVMDQILGKETRNDGVATTAHDWILRSWAPVHVGVLVLGASTVHSFELASAVGLTVGAGLLSAVSLTVAHELMHRRSQGDRALAELVMTSLSYPHFCVEHVLGHHKNVSTPLDPASAHRGQSLYTFLPRTVVGGLRSAWQLETKRTHRVGVAGTLKDRRIRYPIGLLLTWVLAAALGPAAFVFILGQGAVAVLLLEITNYLEHYGLQREMLANGRYERVAPRHSWNTDNRLTNWWLFNLQRHADHHAHASRHYAELRTWPDAPRLPFGYPTMVLAATVPPLWRWLVHPRLDAINAGHLTGAAASKSEGFEAVASEPSLAS